MAKNHHVYDFETISNCFIAVYTHYKENIDHVFVIHETRNDLPALLGFLDECKAEGSWQIGYNCIAFDAQIQQYILMNQKILLKLSGDEVARKIYEKAQDVIGKSNRKEWQDYPEWKLALKQVDVFTLNNWSNPAKSTSLKWAQCGMDWLNVQDMPIEHTATITTQEEIDMTITYCKNDVASTKRIMQLSKDQINLRAQLTAEYGINLYSASEPKMAKELFLHFLSEKTGRDKQEMKKVNTVRDKIPVEKIILPYVQFQRQEFKMLLNNFKTLVINGNKLRGAFRYSVAYRGIRLNYGVGGLHSEAKVGIFEAKEGMIIIDSDVSSYYPNLAIKNKWSPAHLPNKEFCDQYEWFYEERKKIPKSDPRNQVYKILLNSSYGLSIEPNSFLADAQLGVSIVVNGQLLLSMLIEMICEAIPEANPLVANTDGISVMLPERDKEIYHTVCKQWENITKLSLEHEQYQKMCSFDCNNFLNQYVNGKTKCKGRFEFEPHDKYDINVLHKNKSFLIVPKAIYAYLIDGTPPEQYLQENRNIFDYCGFVRAKGQWGLQQYHTGSQGITITPLQKTLRYYITKQGSKITKKNRQDGREIQIEAGRTLCREFNRYEEKRWEDYGVDDDYYLEEIWKEIDLVEQKPKSQLKLF